VKRSSCRSRLSRVFAAGLCLLAFSGAGDILFRDGFEKPVEIGKGWRKSWGPAGRSNEKAHGGAWAIREAPENRYGLSVWYREFNATPGAVYKASAWVFVPEQTFGVVPKLSINSLNWSTLAGASTRERGKWVKLEVKYRNSVNTRLRLQLYQAGQRPGMEGAVMYWDDVSVERELKPVDPKAGIRINPLVMKGMEVVPAGGMKITVKPGVMLVDGTPVTVPDATTFELQSPRRIEVHDEAAVLTDEAPRGYGRGTALELCRSRGTTIAGVLDPASLRIKVGKGPDAELYLEGKDWRADKVWGRVGRLPDGRIGPKTRVYMDYAVSLMRIDTLAVRSDGTVVLRRGNEHKMVPKPPRPDLYSAPLCNVYLPYHCRELTRDNIYPIGPPFPEPGQGELEAKAALIPKTRAKLAAGKDLTVVFWGDSVTCGGNASSPDKAFPLAFTDWLRCRFPESHIRYVNAGTGGWNSKSKLPLFDKEVLSHRPDLVVIEFVNDMGFDREMIFRNYDEAVSKVRALGGEVIILTPHFTRPDWMGAGAGMRTPEIRKAVGYLKEFGREHRVGIADASRRWAHLWIEGIPYLTLLDNAINHPDDRGHALFVDELKLFFLADPEEVRPERSAEPAMPAAKP